MDSLLTLTYSAAAPKDKSCELTANTVLNSTQDAPGAEAQAAADVGPLKVSGGAKPQIDVDNEAGSVFRPY